MDHLYLPPSLRYFEPMRVLPNEPLDHVSLLYDLIEALRPRLVVDVGTGSGTAMAVACQSMRDHDVDGLVYGIDSWTDDEAKAEDDPTRWADLNGFLRTHFRGVSYLMRMEIAEGPSHFADGSVGVLRVNVARAEAPLAALLETWLPKLAPGGVLLCPGVNDEAALDLGSTWKQSMEGRDGFVFPHGSGLGLFRAPSGTAASAAGELSDILASEDAGDRESLARFYEHADRHHSMRLDLSGRWNELRRKK